MKFKKGDNVIYNIENNRDILLEYGEIYIVDYIYDQYIRIFSDFSFSIWYCDYDFVSSKKETK